MTICASPSSSPVRTPGFHPGDRGSNPLGDAKISKKETIGERQFLVNNLAKNKKSGPIKRAFFIERNNGHR